jgi:hypothetical protein
MRHTLVGEQAEDAILTEYIHDKACHRALRWPSTITHKRIAAGISLSGRLAARDDVLGYFQGWRGSPGGGIEATEDASCRVILGAIACRLPVSNKSSFASSRLLHACGPR